MNAAHLPIPTQADRDDDARLEAWKARRRAADLRVLQARLADERRAAALQCAAAYAERAKEAA